MNKKILIAVVIAAIIIIGIVLFMVLSQDTSTNDGAELNTDLNNENGSVLDMAKVQENVLSAKGTGFDRFTAAEAVQNSGINGMDYSLEFIYSFSYNEYGINSENIEETESSFMYNAETKDLYAILTPFEGKAEEVKLEMEAFINSLIEEEIDETIKAKIEANALVEVGNSLVFIISEDVEAVTELTKTATASLLPSLMVVESDFLNQMTGLNPEDLKGFVVLEPAMMVSAATVIVLEPVEGKMQDVEAVMNEYISNLEKEWQTYLPDQYELVMNRKEVKDDNYLIYIISEDNEAVYDVIMDSVK